MIAVMLIALGAIVTIVSNFLKEYKKTTCVLGILVTLIGAGLGIYDRFQKKQKEKKSALSGTLETPQETEKTNIDKDKRLRLLLGGTSLSISTPDISAGCPIQPFKFMKYPFEYPMWVKLTENNIFISMKAKSLDGKIIATIEDNEWKVNPNNFFDRNYDDTALEVIDAYGNLVLRVEMIDQNTIGLRGIFIANDTMIIVDKNGYMAKGMDEIQQSDIDEAIQEYEIDRLFLYPSDEHFGKRRHTE